MKQSMLFLALCFVVFSCKKTVVTNFTCIADEIEQFKTTIHAVSVLTIGSNGERVYKFQTVEGCGDGSVYNEKCEEVCPGGKHIPLASYNCPDADYSEWEVIWEK